MLFIRAAIESLYPLFHGFEKARLPREAGPFSFAHTFPHILPAIVFGSPGALLNVAPGRAGQLFLV